MDWVAIIAFIKQSGGFPCAIDGDLAFVHARYLNFGGRETAGVDIFRFDANGEIIEH